MKKWKLGIGTILFFISTIILSGCGKETIDLNDYFTYEFTGVDGYGSIIYQIRADDIVDDHKDIFGTSNELDDDLVDAYADIEELSGSWDKGEDLSNGDAVEFTWDQKTIDWIEKHYEVKLKNEPITAVVDSLEAVQKYDAFKNLNVTFEGYAPRGTVSLNKENCEINILEYTAEPSDHLKNGDVVTVTVTVPDDCERDYGKIPEKTSKKYTVSGLEGFVASAADISDETLSAMKKQAEDARKAEFANSSSPEEKMVNMIYVGNYFLTIKDSVADSESYYEDRDDDNAIFLVYKIDYSANGQNINSYWYCKFSNITTLSDGKCSVDTTTYEVPDDWEERVEIDKYYYPGYPDITSLFNHCVTKNIASYEYEDNVKGGENNSKESTAEETNDAKEES